MKLNCTPEYFNYLCEKLVGQLAEKNYQLELLASQVESSLGRLNMRRYRLRAV